MIQEPIVLDRTSFDARAFTQRVLDEMEILQIRYHELDFMRPLVAAMVGQVVEQVPEGGRICLAAPPPLLAHVLLRAGYALDLYTLDGQDLDDPALTSMVRGSFCVEELDRETLPFGPDEYDAVVLPRLLEAVADDPINTLYRLRRHLKPGGKLILATMNLSKLGVRIRALRGRDFQPGYLQPAEPIMGGWPPIRHLRYYCMDEIEALAHKSGYGIRASESLAGHEPFYPLQPYAIDAWLKSHLRHGLNQAWPGWREYLVLTLQSLDAFELPGYEPGEIETDRYPIEPGVNGPRWRPFVSVVLPTHNRAKMLMDTLVNGLYQQNYPADRWEIVLVDDGSRDQTPEVIERLREHSPVPMRTFRLEGVGATAARNFGMEQATGEIVAHIDDDGRALPGWLEAGVDAFAPGVALVAGPIIALPGEPVGFFSFVPRMGDDRGLFPSANLFIRRDLALRAGGFDESFGMNVLGRPAPGWDADLAYSLLRQGYTHRFEYEALTFSHVFPLGWKGWFQETRKWGYQAEIIRRIPETRKGLAPVFGIVAEGRKRVLWLLSLLGILLLPWLKLRALWLTLPWLARSIKLHWEDLKRPKRMPIGSGKILLSWLWYLGAFLFLIHGAIRARRLIL